MPGRTLMFAIRQKGNSVNRSDAEGGISVPGEMQPGRF